MKRLLATISNLLINIRNFFILLYPRLKLDLPRASYIFSRVRRPHLGRNTIVIGALVIILIVSGLVWLNQRKNTAQPGKFALTSVSVLEGKPLAAQFTCDGENINPAFEIKNIPPKTKSLAIIMEDKNLDKKTYKDYPFLAHWMVWNIPVSTTKITPGIRPPGTIGRNIFGNFAYGGPCPPAGEKHTYIFTLFALGAEKINITSESGLAQVKSDINKSKIASFDIKVTYIRKKAN